MRTKILVIDDDIELDRLIAQSLYYKGFLVFSATDGQEGLKMALDIHPDLIILDIMMPEMDGWQTCKRLRDITDVPIMMLTALDDQECVIRGFRSGIDDYLAKPFNLTELELRVRAILKRAHPSSHGPTKVYDDGTLHINLENRQVLKNGHPIHLTSTEFQVLSCLVRHQGYVVPREHLLTEVWGPAHTYARSSLALYIRYLRKKLEKNPQDPHYIRTEWGVGYWFAPMNDRTQEHDTNQ